MPIYEYRCTQCQGRLEVLVTAQEAPLPDCSTCGNTAWRRVPSRFSVRGLPLAQESAPGGGCCGGGCGCGRAT